MKTNFKTQYDKMTRMPIPKLIITLGIPTTISMLVTNIYNMADTLFVGQLGTSASGAIGIVFGIMAILQAFGFMFGQGAGSIISRMLGNQDAESASRIASTSFFLSFGIGLLFSITGLLFLAPVVRLMGSTPTILPYAKDYALYIFLSAPFMTSSFVMNNILRYEGKAALAMIGLTAGGLLNIAGDAVLMFGFDMGIAGAGISTAVSQVISFFLLLFMFLSGRTQSRLSIHHVTQNFREILKIMGTGFPSLTRQGLGSLSTILLNHQASLYGDAAVAAMSIVGRIAMFIFSIGLGIGQGYQPVAGFNYGAGIYSRVKEGFVFTLVSGEVLLGTLTVLGLLFSPHIIRLFRNDPEVIRIGTTAFRLQCIALLFQPLTLCITMVLQSIGKSVKATFLSLLRNGLYFIPLILILPRFLGLTAVETAQPAADILTFLTCIPFTVSFFRRLPTDKSH